MSEHTADDLPPGVRRIAQEAIAGALVHADRQLICALARAVRGANAAPGPANAALVPPALRALATAIGLLPADHPSRTLAELRVFARLTVAECARLLAEDERAITLRWRVVRLLVFARARRLLRSGPCPRSPGTTRSPDIGL